MIMPVPAAWPDPTTVLMSTIAGSTLAAMACALRLPPLLGLVGWSGDSDWVDGCVTWAVGVCELMVRARLHPSPAPAAAAMTASTTTPAARRCQKLLLTGGAGGAGGGGGAQ